MRQSCKWEISFTALQDVQATFRSSRVLFPSWGFFFFMRGEWITSVWALNKAACSKTDVVCCTLAERMSSLFTVEPGANFFWNTNSCLTAPPARLDTTTPHHHLPGPLNVCVLTGVDSKRPTRRLIAPPHPPTPFTYRTISSIPAHSPNLIYATTSITVKAHYDSPVLGCLLKQPPYPPPTTHPPPAVPRREWVGSCWRNSFCTHTNSLSHPTLVTQTSVCCVWSHVGGAQSKEYSDWLFGCHRTCICTPTDCRC